MHFIKGEMRTKYNSLEVMLKDPSTNIWGGFYNKYIAFNTNEDLFFCRYEKVGLNQPEKIFIYENPEKWIKEAQDYFENLIPDEKTHKFVALSFHTEKGQAERNLLKINEEVNNE